MMNRFIMVIDNFYYAPDSVRQIALNMTFATRKDTTGCRTQRYQPKGIREGIERAIKWRIKSWEDEKVQSEYDNGAFFSGFDKGRYAETPYVHYDTPTNWLTLLIYMTPDAPFDAGTSTWQHRETGLISNPTRKDAEGLKTSIRELREIFARDADNPKRWRELDRVGNVYNRAVVFTSNVLHSASKHFGSDQFNGRIFQGFRFSVDRKA